MNCLFRNASTADRVPVRNWNKLCSAKFFQIWFQFLKNLLFAFTSWNEYKLRIKMWCTQLELYIISHHFHVIFTREHCSWLPKIFILSNIFCALLSNVLSSYPWSIYLTSWKLAKLCRSNRKIYLLFCILRDVVTETSPLVRRVRLACYFGNDGLSFKVSIPLTSWYLVNFYLKLMRRFTRRT